MITALTLFNSIAIIVVIIITLDSIMAIYDVNEITLNSSLY